METSTRLAVAYAINALWQLPLLVLATEIVVRLLGWTPGKVLHRVWLGCLFLALTVPALSFLQIPRHIFGSGLIRSQMPAAPQALDDKKSLNLAFLGGPFESSAHKPRSAADLSSLISDGALFLYLASVLFALTRFAWGIRKTQTLLHSAEEMRPTREVQEIWDSCLTLFGVTRIKLMSSSKLGGPATVTWRDPIVLASLLGGAVLLAGFLFVERASAAPMLPLGLFQSRTFSAVNLLTLLLYAALGTIWFFLPFALIQVHGYPATLAGVVSLPFTILMVALSRWAGGLLDRYGARLPLIVGPTIAAFGIALTGIFVPNGAYWQFLVAITILGLGMVISVAPLTTAVIDAVPAHQTGIASGINNAVASVANLLAVAALGAVAIFILNRLLDGQLQSQILSAGVKHAIAAARGQLVIEPALTNLQGDDRATAALILRRSLAESIKWVMLMAAVIALSGAAAATLIPRPNKDHGQRNP